MDLFNDIGRMITHASRAISGQLDVPETPAEEITLHEVRIALEQTYAQLGRACYDAAEKPSDCVSPDLYCRIHTLEEQFNALVNAQTHPDRMVRCPGCGTLQEKTARFCSACGRILPDSTAQNAMELTPDPDSEYCPKCGALRHTDNPLCDVCGYDFLQPRTAEVTPAQTTFELNITPMEEPDYTEDSGEA